MWKQILTAAAAAALLAACNTTTPEPETTAADDPRDPACERTYRGGAASALANSGQGCAVMAPSTN